SCATTVPGLYAAGDAATRELICGGFTGGGSHNAAWAMSSGTFAGQGAADYARHAGSTRGGRLSDAGTIALRPRAKRQVQPDDRQRHYITSGGLDQVWTAVRPYAEAAYAEAAE